MLLRKIISLGENLKLLFGNNKSSIGRNRYRLFVILRILPNVHQNIYYSLTVVYRIHCVRFIIIIYFFSHLQFTIYFRLLI